MKTSMFSYPYFVKNVHSLKKLYSHAHILSKKRPLSQKTLCYNVIFSNFPWKFPCYYAHTWAENVHSVKITSYYGRKRSIGCPFFFNLPWKNHCSHPLILSTKGPFSKKYGKFAQNTKLAEYYSVNWTKMSEIFSKHLKIKEISEIMSEICSKYRKSVDIMVQIWEDFFF